MSFADMESFQKYLFMLLYAKGSTNKQKEAITGNLWLHKAMFLISKSFGDLEDEFEPYYLGPFSEKLEAYVDQFESSDYVESPSKISLTERGEQIASKVWQDASEKERQTITRIKEFLNNLTNEELLGYIYQSYPEMTAKSKVKDDIENKREMIATSLFSKRKVSIEKAAAIAGLSLEEFLELLKKKRIPIVPHLDTSFAEELKSLERHSCCDNNNSL